jgi:hypothetical protein
MDAIYNSKESPFMNIREMNDSTYPKDYEKVHTLEG